MTSLRPYQQRALQQIGAAVQAGATKPLVVMPTGAGKTRIAGELIKVATEGGNPVLFLAPRRELVTQASLQLMQLGIGHGVILAGADAGGGLYETVQVASIDTLLSRVVRRNKLTIIDPALIIIDEAHLSITVTRKALLDRWSQAIRIGLTATPTRKDGRALGLLYDRLIEPVSVADWCAMVSWCRPAISPSASRI